MAPRGGGERFVSGEKGSGEDEEGVKRAVAEPPAPLTPPPESARPASPDELPFGLRTIVTLAVLAATLMEVLDTSIVNVALPNMEGELGATLDEIGWVSTGYIISNVVILPLTAYLSDYFGRRKYLGYSLMLFTAASLGCGISRSLNMLVLFRILQGTGGAAFLSTAQATLMEIYPKRLQGFAQAMFGIGVVMAPTLGPSLGGFLTDRFSWPMIFFVNIPIGILATFLTFTFVPDSHAARGKRQADFMGIGLLALGLGTLQFVLERGEREDWFSSPLINTLVLLSASGLAAFIWWELRPGNRNPAVDLRVLKNRNLAAGAIWGAMLGFVLYGSVFALPQFFQVIQPHTAEQTGILLIPGGLATVLVLPFVGQLVNRVDTRYMVAIGMLLASASMWQFSTRFTLDSPDSAFFWPLITRGVAMGLQFVPLSLLSLGTLPPKDLSQGAGLYNLMRQLGGSFGIAVLATFVERRTAVRASTIGSHLSEVSLATQQRMAQIGQGMVARGMPPALSNQLSYGVLKLTVLKQAMLGSYVDVFRFSAALALVSTALVFLFQRARARGGAAAAAH